MTHCIEKSGTGIEKSGTGVERSGTGIDSLSNHTPRRRCLKHGLLGAALLCTAVTAHASDPHLMVSQTDAGIRVSLHVDQRILVGRVDSASPLSGLVAMNLYDVDSLAAASTQTYGSGTGGRVACSTLGTQTYGSGTGGSTDTYGSGTGGSTDTYGSGTGGSTDTYGSGTGGSTDTYGSGTGGSTDTYGSGTGGSTDTYGSGTGRPDGCSASIARWGQVELVIDPDATYALVHRDSETGREEVLATVEPATGAR